MNGPSFPLLVEAELRKLASRRAVKVGLVLLGALGVVVPALLFLVMSTVEVDGEGAVNPFLFSAVDVVDYTLRTRNFFVFRILLIMWVALSIGGELTARTLREDLLRPVSRAAVLGAKAVALSVCTAAGLVVPLVLAGFLGLVLFEGGEGWATVLPKAGWTLLGDLGFGALVVAIALWVRSVSGTVVGVVLYWMFDKVLGFALWGVEKARGMVPPEMTVPGWVDGMIEVRPFLPSAAFDVVTQWDATRGMGAAWEAMPKASVGSLVVLTVVASAVAVVRLRTMDVD